MIPIYHFQPNFVCGGYNKENTECRFQSGMQYPLRSLLYMILKFDIKEEGFTPYGYVT